MFLGKLRKEYSGRPLDPSSADNCPFKQFEIWFSEALASEIPEPNAMVLSTVAADGKPTQRTVLLKIIDEAGLVFFTNYESRKASQIELNQQVSILFPWYSLQRQVEVSGVASKVSTVESMKYFALRPRGSQLGAWVSKQSSTVSNRNLLQEKFTQIKKQFARGEIPMPPAWGGFRIKPSRFEFWQGGKDRLHDRLEYGRISGDNKWSCVRLSP